MKNGLGRSVGAVAVLSLLSLAGAACSFSSDSRPAQPAPPPGYYPPQGYPQQPGYPPQAQVAPRPGYAPQPAPPPGYAPNAVGPGIAAFFEPINVANIQAIAARNPKACGFLEVSPQNWKRVDCHAYAPARTATAHLSQRKAIATASHTTQWKPQRAFAAQFQQLLTQGFSKSIFQKAPNVAGPQAVVGDAPPAAIDHRAQGLEGPIKDQGPVGACTAFSLSTTIDNAAIRAGKMPGNSGAQASSANHVWAGYGYPEMGRAADATKGRAIAPMSLWGQSFSEECEIADPTLDDCGPNVTPRVIAGSFRTDAALQAKAKRADAGGVYRVGSIEGLAVQPANMDQIIQILASGSDLWIAMRIDGFAWSNSKMPNAVIPDWAQENGGHAVTMAGYRVGVTGRQFLVHNNWGTSWGDGGYGWVSEAMIQKWMNFAYQVKLTDQPAPGNAADDDCGADQLIDILTGACGGICPDNTRPLNGCAAPGQAPVIPTAFPTAFPTALPSGFPTIPGFPPATK